MKKKVLIVSTYGIRCGIASFTEVLRSQLRDDFDIDVYPLDQELLRNPDRRAGPAGDALIERIVEVAQGYDLVNLQWEPGFFGLRQGQILRRFRTLLQGIKKLVITAHTVLPVPLPLTPTVIADTFKTRGWAGLPWLAGQAGNYSRKTYAIISEAQASKPVHLITHTRRDRRLLERVVGLNNVHDHPLSHMDPAWADKVMQAADIERARFTRMLGPDAVLLGVYGFLSKYKSFETAIAALRHLPENYHLLIYGGVHHVAVKPRVPVDPYVKMLLDLVNPPDTTLIPAAGVLARASRRPQDATGLEALERFADAHAPLKDRVHFMGSPDDFEFAVAMAAVDACIFPYLEVGQSGSGPVSQALELGKKVIATNNKAFSEVQKYYPEKIHFFDIGNHVQLAQKAASVVDSPAPNLSDLKYTQHTQRAFYRDIFNSI